MKLDKNDPIRKAVEALIDPKFPKIHTPEMQMAQREAYKKRHGSERFELENHIRSSIFWLLAGGKLRFKSEYSQVDLLQVDMAVNSIEWREMFTRHMPLPIEGFDDKYCMKCWDKKKKQGTENEHD